MINILNKQNNNQEEASGASADEIKENIMNEISGVQEKEKISAGEGITIHTMPEKFRSAGAKHSSSKKMGMFIIIGGAILLLGIFGGAYYYLFMNNAGGPDQAIQQEDLPNEKEPADVSQKDLQDNDSADENLSGGIEDKEQEKSITVKSAKEMYLAVKAELDSAKDFYDYEQIIEKYGSEKRLLELKSQKSEYSGLTVAEREDFFSSLAGQAPKLDEIENITESISGNMAMLSIKIKDISEKATVKMINENEEWKLESEDWPEFEDQEIHSFKPAQDSDKDGLTDKEEGLLGCNLNSADSDGDGYEDLSELMNLYNPAGAGGLIENLSINQYFNKTYDYNIYHPDSWTQSAVGGDDSILFKSSDNHFIQIMVQPNAGKIQIEDWYKKQFNISLVKPEKKITAESWQGVRSEDGLIVYLTDSSLNYIFIITYNPGLNDSLEYVNIFEMAVQSLEVKI